MYKRKLLPDERALIPLELSKTLDLFATSGYEIYLVGGGVRNILLNERPRNCDLTTNATPEQSLEVLKDLNPFYNNDFGTVSFNCEVDGNKELYEITTYRSEKEYSDYRRPDNLSWGKTLEEDVVRRDFTINAMVISKKTQNGEWELIDLVGGLEDFEKGLIRAVGEPDRRFREDALRMMRCIRFAAKLGFSIDIETLKAVTKNAELLEKISKERVREEFIKILGSEYPADGVNLLITTNLINYFLPEILEGRNVAQGGHHEWSVLEHSVQSLRNCPSPDPVVRLCALLHDVGKPRSQRFKCRKCGKMFRDLPEEQHTCANCGYTQPTRGMITFYGHEVVGARMAKEIAERLRFNRKDTERIETLVRWHMFAYQSEMTDASIRRLIRKVGKENIADLVLLRIADRKGSGSKTTSWRFLELQKRIGEQLFEPMEINDMAVNGKDVMESLGVKPGPIIGKVLTSLFEEVLEDTSKNQRDYLLKRIKEIGKKMNSLYQRSNKLFTGIIYESITDWGSFVHIKSVFKDAWYNFIVPKVLPDKLDWAKVRLIIKDEKEKGIDLSYYVPESLNAEYTKYFATHVGGEESLGSDFYMFFHNEQGYKAEGELILLDDSNLGEYIEMSNTCFPEWENNKTYAQHVYKHQKTDKEKVVKNFLFKSNNQLVGFCGVIMSPEQNLAYFHNVGVLPEYRRKGHFTSIIKLLINEALQNGIGDSYALVEFDGGSYHGLTKLGYRVVDKYYLFSTSS